MKPSVPGVQPGGLGGGRSCRPSGIRPPPEQIFQLERKHAAASRFAPTSPSSWVPLISSRFLLTLIRVLVELSSRVDAGSPPPPGSKPPPLPRSAPRCRFALHINAAVIGLVVCL